MARPKIVTVNIKNFQDLYANLGNLVDYLPIIAYTMRECGCTYTEIGEVFGIKRQQAEYFVNTIRKALKQPYGKEQESIESRCQERS